MTTCDPVSIPDGQTPESCCWTNEELSGGVFWPLDWWRLPVLKKSHDLVPHYGQVINTSLEASMPRHSRVHISHECSECVDYTIQCQIQSSDWWVSEMSGGVTKLLKESFQTEIFDKIPYFLRHFQEVGRVPGNGEYSGPCLPIQLHVCKMQSFLLFSAIS